MAISDEKIKELLGSGLPRATVASAVGCSESYITQLMSQQEFAEDVIARRTTSLTAHSRRDQGIDVIEDKLIERIGELVDNNHIYKPNEVMRAFQVINAAKRRGISANEHLHSHQTVVNLTIPPQFLKKFSGYTINGHGEVVESEGQTLVSMPANQVLRQLVDGSGTQEQKAIYEQTARHLPGTAAINSQSLTRRSDEKNVGWRGDSSDV